MILPTCWSKVNFKNLYNKVQRYIFGLQFWRHHVKIKGVSETTIEKQHLLDIILPQTLAKIKKLIFFAKHLLFLKINAQLANDICGAH